MLVYFFPFSLQPWLLIGLLDAEMGGGGNLQDPQPVTACTYYFTPPPS